MLGLMLSKELKVFFSSKGNLAVMILLPSLLLLIFGAALGNYMKFNFETFKSGVDFYYNDTEKSEMLTKFTSITAQVSAATDVSFEKIDDLETAKSQVESSEAYGVITISDDNFDYFRSTFNEPKGGIIVRNLFSQLANGDRIERSLLEHETLAVQPPDSVGYYTFSGLAFSILFMGLIVAFSIHNEKTLETIKRIRLSKAGITRMIVAKVLTGLMCGVGQIIVSFIFSAIVFKVSWGAKVGWIVILFLLLSLYSAIFGGVMGLICKNKATCQSVVLMVSMFSGYLGGSITPLFLLENTPVMNVLVNISPLYHLNRAVLGLRNNLMVVDFFYSVLVLLGLISVFTLIGVTIHKKISFSGEKSREVAKV